MPRFSRQAGVYFSERINGPSHISIGLRFSETPVQQPILTARPPRFSFTTDLDPQRILAAAQQVVAEANAQWNATIYLAEVVYYEGDLPRYEFYTLGACEIAERILHNHHAEFTDL